jgi:hypothetical protein
LPRTIAAGETLEMKCLLDLYETEGEFIERINLFFQGSAPSQFVQLTGRVVAPLPETVDLGAFSPPIRRVIPLRKLHGLSNVAIHSVDSISPYVHAAVAPGGLEISVDEAPLGMPILGRLTVAFEGGTLSRQEVAVHGIASGGLVAKPDKIIFGRLLRGKPAATREVSIEAVDGRPFSLAEAVCNQDDVSVELIRKGDAQTLCRITMNPLHPMKIEETITFVTTDGRRGVILPCLGMVE